MRCAICGKDRQSGPQRSLGDWTCVLCTYLNPSHTTICMVCNHGQTPKGPDSTGVDGVGGVRGSASPHPSSKPSSAGRRDGDRADDAEQVYGRVKCVRITALAHYFGTLTISSTHLTFVGRKIKELETGTHTLYPPN